MNNKTQILTKIIIIVEPILLIAIIALSFVFKTYDRVFFIIIFFLANSVFFFVVVLFSLIKKSLRNTFWVPLSCISCVLFIILFIFVINIQPFISSQFEMYTMFFDERLSILEEREANSSDDYSRQIEIVREDNHNEEIQDYNEIDVPSGNLVVNSSFEDGDKSPIGWCTPYAGADFIWDEGVSKTGSNSVSICNIEENTSVDWLTEDYIQVEENNTYTLSIWVKGTSYLEASITIWPYDTDGIETGPGLGATVFVTSDWSQIVLPPDKLWPGTKKVKISFGLSNSGSKDIDCVWFDDVFFGQVE